MWLRRTGTSAPAPGTAGHVMRLLLLVAAAAFIVGAFASQGHALFDWNATTWMLGGFGAVAFDAATGKFRL
jgi:hypothetical protein